MTTNLQREKKCRFCGTTMELDFDSAVNTCGECWKKHYPTPPTDTTVEKWEKREAIALTDSIFNAIAWEKHYTVKERQALNDVVDEIVAHSLQQAKAEAIKEERSRIIKLIKKKRINKLSEFDSSDQELWGWEYTYALEKQKQIRNTTVEVILESLSTLQQEEST